MTWDITISEPTVIRGYTKGGMGGWGSSSTPLHRLVRRTVSHDEAACGNRFTSLNTSVKPAGKDGRPSKKDAERYGLCRTCWPDR